MITITPLELKEIKQFKSKKGLKNISFSLLSALASSEKKFLEYLQGKIVSNYYMRIGCLGHAIILTKKIKYVNNLYCKHSNPSILSHIAIIVNKLKKYIFESSEKTLYGIIEINSKKFILKSIIDGITINKEIIELKISVSSFKNIIKTGFIKYLCSKHYDLQVYLYKEILKAHNVNINNIILIFTELSFPWRIEEVKIDESIITKGKNKLIKLTNKLIITLDKEEFIEYKNIFCI